MSLPEEQVCGGTSRGGGRLGGPVPLGDLPETQERPSGPPAGTLPASPKASQRCNKELILHVRLHSLQVTRCLQFRLHFNCCSGSLTVNSYLHARERKHLCCRDKPQLAVDDAAVISTAKMFLLDSSSPRLLRGSEEVNESNRAAVLWVSKLERRRKGGKAEWQHLPVGSS